MFEWQIALKYLVPKKRSLSTALISLMSVFVISLVVWLVLVFLSVTKGIEENWLSKLTSLYAPLRISPTEKYYSSYFYQVDAISSASNYTFKTLGEKAAAATSDPYLPELDMEPPAHWPKAAKTSNGKLIDPVKTAIQEIESLGLVFQDYEISGALLRLGLRKNGEPGISHLSQMSYLLSLPSKNPRFETLVISPTLDELNQLLTTNPACIQHIENGVFAEEGQQKKLLSGSARTKYDTPPASPPLWAYFVNGECFLPSSDTEMGALLPKFYQESGAKIGDLGSISYSAASAASTQEQKIAIRVAGFYDPGILPVGNRCLIVPQEVTRSIYASTQTFSPDGTPTNGFFVWTKDPAQSKLEIEKRFAEANISPYWHVASYEEFEFSKDLLQQFQSDRTLFLLIAAIILIVACCNIISLLVLLVNDKKKEIAILHALGAPFSSIAAIFGLCGMIMGCAACLLGSLGAIFTLHHLGTLVSWLSALQGHAAFHPAFFGSALPNQLSYDALYFVLIATPLLSLTAGLIPALKAARIRPSSVLRAE
ncbi:MAG: ABC transporter permease [Chlamydiae bacterium]|nr:ABC transporter permease [Chlamydiota bacterium]